MITRTDLDYLSTAVRAAQRHPDNATLWAEAVRAQRGVIATADATMPDALAAEVQAQVGYLAGYAVDACQWAADRAEHIKDVILALTGAAPVAG